MENTKIVELFWKRDKFALEAASAKYGAYCHTIAYNILENEQDAENGAHAFCSTLLVF